MSTHPVPNVSREVLCAIGRQKVPLGSTTYSDRVASDDGLITEGYGHVRIPHDRTFVQSQRRHIHGIENFWWFAKTELRRNDGVDAVISGCT